MRTIKLPKIDISTLKDEKIQVTFTSTYNFPISWLCNDGKTLSFNSEDNTLEKALIREFESSFFSDAFGRIPASTFTLNSLICSDVLKQYFIKKHQEYQNKELEQQVERKSKLAKDIKERISCLKKELEELENADK
jgi:hypothetical protein